MSHIHSISSGSLIYIVSLSFQEEEEAEEEEEPEDVKGAVCAFAISKCMTVGLSDATRSWPREHFPMCRSLFAHR